MVLLSAFGGLGTPEILALILLLLLIVISPLMWFQERNKRKYWQAKAEDYENKLLNMK